MGEVVKFSSVLRVSIELDILTGRIEEVKTLSISEVDTVKNSCEEDEDDDNHNVQPSKIGFDLLNTVLLGRHFFRRGLTASTTFPTAGVGGFATTTSTRSSLRSTLSS